MKGSGKLVAETLPARHVAEADRNRMWEIFEKYYTDVTRPMFEKDLEGKDHVILVRDGGDGSLQGFSTLQILHETVEGRPLVAVFSGDTIIEARYWGQSALQRAFFAYIVKQKLRHPGQDVYWFLISKGYRTYLLLSRNFVEYWPRHEKSTPPWQAQVIDTLARRKFGSAWKPERGILEFSSCMGRLRESVAPIDSNVLAWPDIRFFAERNPGHLKGDELCCLGKVDGRLALAYPWKLFRRLARKRLERPRGKTAPAHP